MKRFGTIGLCVCALMTAGRGADAATLTVNAGGDLQAALNAANPGDTILLEAGATFTGNFTLPAKGGTSYITIRSSAPDSSLPAAGQRITPAYAGLLPKLRGLSRGGLPLRTAVGASYWRVLFVEFVPGTLNSAALVEFGRADSTQNTLSAVPHHLILDRCYLHGDPASGVRRGLALNSGTTQVLNSYISNFKLTDQDTQAIGGWNGPGPYLIENNYLEAAGENIMFGGGDPYIVDLTPANITIRRNLISRPLSWMSQSWAIKNLIEFKNAKDVLIEGNVIENNWAAQQQGYSIVMVPRNQDGTAPWSVVKNVTIRNNIIRHVAAVFNICGYDNLATSQQARGFVIENNLMYDVSTAYATPDNPANGRVIIMGCGTADITFNHNTADNNGSMTVVMYGGYAPSGPEIDNLVLTNNLLRDNKYGIFGDNSSEGTPSLTKYAPNAYVQANGIGGASASVYPVGNDYPTLTQWLADFVDRASANYELTSTSLSNGAATDGKDIGVDFAQLRAAMDPAAAPTGTSSSRPYTGTPYPAPGKVQFENYDKGGMEISYHDTTAGNAGGVYRTNSVDIQATTDSGGGYNVGWTAAGEWLKYTLNIAASGTYTIDVRVAQKATGGRFHIEVDGVDKTGPIAVPATGGWQTWTTVTKTGVALPGGTHVVRVVMDATASNGFVGNFNWFVVR